MSLYVVALHRKDGQIKYAGEEGWRQTDSPERVFTSLRSAKGSVRHWTKQHALPGKTNADFISIEILSVEIVTQEAEYELMMD